ncbi:MAG: hydrogenase [Planctomycetes bacterium]|nr:hydrogenase [Planctomycetota bacterium]
MHTLTDAALVGVVLASFLALGTSRLTSCIRATAIQGWLLALLSVAIHEWPPTGHTFFIAAVSLVMKGILIPILLERAIRQASVRREVEPFIGYASSLVLGGILVVTAFGIAGRLPLPHQTSSTLLVPTALSTLMIGLLLLVSRTKALNQVVGYLVAENGIFIFGMSLTREVPLLIEAGILLDVFVGVFVMGIVMYQINQEFDRLDTRNLNLLKD